MLIDVDRHGSFTLDPELTAGYADRPVRWGFGALSWATYKRTYSRDGESWWQTCRRVIEGTFTVLRIHHVELGIPWDERAAQDLARDAYERMWCFKWMPPGRGLWIMGTRHMYEHGGAALNNCGFTSTGDLRSDYAAPFKWMLGMSMLGVGVGFDTRGKGTVTIGRPETVDEAHTIGDSREGWAAALERLLGAYTGRTGRPARWDFSQIRPSGTPLRSFGGVASGPGPLREMLAAIDALYGGHVGRPVDAQLIVDTMNIVGRCVVAGGARRSAQIAFGDADDTQFLDLKQDEEKLMAYRWASNNSVFATEGMDYAAVAERTVKNGEPGYLWLDTARAYGRLADPADHRDERAMGSNPCVEQTLEDHELCCLVETYPAHHDGLDDFLATLRIAHLYAKAVTLVPTHDERTNGVIRRNRRMGCSMTGIVQAINRIGKEAFFRWCDAGYRHIQKLDAKLSERLRVPCSIKTTSVKPSGTVSLLAGATPGVHWDHAPYYIRRVRVTEGHPLVDMCRSAGYEVEPDAYADRSMVVSFPVHVADLGRKKSEVAVREKVDLAAQMQHYWSDNQVSCTAELDPETEGDSIPGLLADYDARLKAISFLPARAHGYVQPPYEEIDRARYERMVARLRPIEGELGHENELESRFCEGNTCELDHEAEARLDRRLTERP